MTVVKYTCGHEVTFRDAAPQKGELVICLKCLKDVRVVRVKTNVKVIKRREEE